MTNILTILLYHGVTRIKSRGIENYSRKHLFVDDFYQQMKYIKTNCRILSMDEIIEIKMKEKDYPQNSVAVSFDDGFENNYSVAGTVLDDLKVPAVFYVCSGIVNTDMMFWVDILEDCINYSGADKVSIQLDNRYEFYLRDYSEKILALETIKSYCKRSNAAEKNRILAEISELTKVVSDVSHSENYKKITWSQLKEMNTNPLFTLGGHSLYHDILSSLPIERMKLDIKLSIDLLEYHLGKKINHYSYPEGQAHHYNEDVIQFLKAGGITCCPSAIDGVNDISTDLFHLKRIMVGFKDTPFPFGSFDR